MKNTEMHKEVVTGVIKIILYLNKEANKESFSLGELYKVGADGMSEKASGFIFEFIKDGVISLKKEDIERVVNGDYSLVWEITNRYLKSFGYQPVEPVQIELS